MIRLPGDHFPQPEESSASVKDPRKTIGRQGELWALRHLQMKGYDVIARNWRCRSGEIDLIAKENDSLVFIEVRTRSGASKRFGTALESVDWRKQRQVRETARVYLHQNKDSGEKIRFDVISVVLSVDGVVTELRHIEHAF